MKKKPFAAPLILRVNMEEMDGSLTYCKYANGGSNSGSSNKCRAGSTDCSTVNTAMDSTACGS